MGPPRGAGLPATRAGGASGSAGRAAGPPTPPLPAVLPTSLWRFHPLPTHYRPYPSRCSPVPTPPSPGLRHARRHRANGAPTRACRRSVLRYAPATLPRSQAILPSRQP